ncbi:expressed protein [Echinococcus multilocularis]|uniref:Expressed protein n=1 Tax=Echinococcus multilocularis TaxID=6211 RepID=A0A068Y9M2_ECHMU|nr:expressed protein [Echinococcus multilocularis]
MSSAVHFRALRQASSSAEPGAAGGTEVEIVCVGADERFSLIYISLLTVAPIKTCYVHAFSQPIMSTQSLLDHCRTLCRATIVTALRCLCRDNRAAKSNKRTALSFLKAFVGANTMIASGLPADEKPSFVFCLFSIPSFPMSLTGLKIGNTTQGTAQFHSPGNFIRALFLIPSNSQ